MARSHSSIVIAIHSTAYYLLSYIVIFLVFQLTTVLTASFFEIPAILHYNKIDFLVNTQSWNYDSVKMIFSSGPVICLIFGLISLIIFLKASSFEGLLKLFFFWAAVHGLSLFVGSVVTGAFIYEGMGYVFAWMYLTETLKMFLLFLGLSLMIGVGTILVKPMLLTGNSYFSTGRPEDRIKFKFYQFILPYFVGTLILILLRSPLSLYELVIIVIPFLSLLPMFSRHHQRTIFFFDEKERNISIQWKPVLISILLLVIFRLVLAYGVRVG